jgi:hypothetical protein
MEKTHLKIIIKEYFKKEIGSEINKPNTLNFISKVFDLCDVYISNKALKHVVESRKYKDRLSVKDIVNLIFNLGYIIANPDIIFINEKTLYSIGLIRKNLYSIYLNDLIILEYSLDNNHYEIITIYQKEDKKIKKYTNIKHLIT